MGRPVVALHGFTHTGAQFRGFASQIGREVLAPDLPGHGSSAADPTDLPSVLDAIARVVGHVSRPVPLIGYSQGARIALLVALEDPDAIERLVLISGSAGIADPTARRDRLDADRRLADDIRSVGLATFIDRWTSEGITSTLSVDPVVRAEDIASRMQNTAEGLASALEGYGQGSQPSVWGRLGGFERPVLVITGAEDAKYTSVGDDLATSLPHAEHVAIVRAGHNPLLDQPDATAAALSAFLDRNG
jgi:2-succinyl-6-hydroxy-2,4-cyclohexadiene-1-carboxylate synthase